jgi:hypothetical protein
MVQMQMEILKKQPERKYSITVPDIYLAVRSFSEKEENS